ncbi:MAG: alpha-ketoacid dehydrogenase subunit beta [Alphaproteobacteria bacterium]|nr:alpha-ketoacid dehydrogenase subunit beta [Alphaproteobacteria bacterium]
MAKKSYRQAVNEAIQQEMRRDSAVILIGEDVAGGAGAGGKDDAWGGPMAVTKGLLAEFGAERVVDTPISEAGYIGMAIGAAAGGLRPIADLMFNDFIGVCFDQVVNQAAKYRYMYGGQDSIPLTIRTMIGAGLSISAQHSQCLYPVFSYFAGLKVVVPSCPYDAKGLLISAIRDNDPVIFCEHKLLYDMVEEVPDSPYSIPFGEARFVRDGGDVTIVALSRMVHIALEAATILAEQGIDCEIIDPRTTTPLDVETILESVAATGRLVIVDEAGPRCGMAADIAAMVAEDGFSSLKAPIIKVTPPHSPIPAAPNLEKLYIPDAARVIAAVHKVMGRKD